MEAWGGYVLKEKFKLIKLALKDWQNCTLCLGLTLAFVGSNRGIFGSVKVMRILNFFILLCPRVAVVMPLIQCWLTE